MDPSWFVGADEESRGRRDHGGHNARAARAGTAAALRFGSSRPGNENEPAFFLFLSKKGGARQKPSPPARASFALRR
jgi:hypothetical protein